MFKHATILLLLVTLTFATSGNSLKSGIDPGNLDTSVKPQDNFYYYANGNWLKSTEIPADKAYYGSFHMLFDESQKNLLEIIEECAHDQNKPGSVKQQIGDFYLSYMDTTLVEKLGIEIINPEMERIMLVNNRSELIELMAYLKRIGVGSTVQTGVDQDYKKATRYAYYLSQSGIGLPDREYFFKEDERFRIIRKKYLDYIEKLLTLARIENAADKAKKIFEMEKSLAEHHWTPVQNRDVEKIYNKYSIKELNQLMPDFNWTLYLKKLEIKNVDYVIVNQPSYFEALNEIINKFTLDDWKNYYIFRLVKKFANLLNKDFVDTHFNFYSKTLSGVQQQLPRWKLGVSLVNSALGEAVGKVYVARHFKPEAKARMVELVDNLKIAFRERINNLEWMSSETKIKALEKLNKFFSKIGYPDKWKTYSGLVIKKDELLQNYMRSKSYEYQREIKKLGKPINREDWFLPPQTINAFYNPPMNEIVFPAAILQPPFFSMEADDAVNYGAIGAVIGHEMSHGFDDQGSKFNGDGNMENWWKEKDLEEFNVRGKVLIDQFSKYEPMDSVFVNGELTLGENIGDLGGLSISYHAYINSLEGKEASVIDGFTGNQRFFLGWAQIWRAKYRDAFLEQLVMTDPHSPAEYRVNGILTNMFEFYKAFNIKEGDPMFRPVDQRAKIW